MGDEAGAALFREFGADMGEDLEVRLALYEAVRNGGRWVGSVLMPDVAVLIRGTRWGLLPCEGPAS
jgi:hypothetical protein